MDGWMVDVQHTLALESYKHNNNFCFLIEKHFFFVVLNCLNFSFYINFFFNVFSWSMALFFIICRLDPL